MTTIKFMSIQAITFLVFSQIAVGFEISDGSSISVPQKGFAVEAPAGWRVHRNFPGTTLLLESPRNAKGKYQRTIQVMAFNGPQFIDDLTRDQFGQKIVQKFSKASNSVRDYSIRNSMLTQLQDGRDAILFYTEFELNEHDMMQAHILASSEELHYLLTFTDVIETFESEGESDKLTEAWNSLTSLTISGETPSRSGIPTTGVALLVMIASMLVILWLWRRLGTSRTISDHRINEPGDGVIESKSLDLYSESSSKITGTIDTSQSSQPLSGTGSWSHLVKPSEDPSAISELDHSQDSSDPIESSDIRTDESRDKWKI